MSDMRFAIPSRRQSAVIRSWQLCGRSAPKTMGPRRFADDDARDESWVNLFEEGPPTVDGRTFEVFRDN